MSRSQEYFWNAAAGGVGAAEAVIMTMIVTRTGTIDDIGVFSIAYATGNLFMTIGKFGARTYHSTDVTGVYSFSTYLRCRLFTVLVMIFALLGYIFYQSYWHHWHIAKVLASMLITMIYMVETIEDCLWGELQRNSRLYVGGQMFIARWLAILLVFFLAMALTGNLTTALLMALMTSVFVFALCIWRVRQLGFLPNHGQGHKRQGKDGSVNHSDKATSLVSQLCPLFAASFLVLYLHNAPKFAIDSAMSDEAQAYYGLVAMPAFVILLLHQFVYQPTLPTLAAEWIAGDLAPFRRHVYKQTLSLLAISAVCIVAAAKFGIQFLSWLYHVNLSDYWRELMLLQVTGIFMALSGYLTVLLTIMREGKRLLWGYALTTALAWLIINPLTRAKGTIGASSGYLLLMLCLSLIFGAMYWRRCTILPTRTEGTRL